MLKREEEEIDGFKFTTVQFSAMYGLGLMTRLAKVLVPIMGAMNGLSADTLITDAMPQLTTAISSLDPDEAQRLVLEILKSTSVIIPDPTGGRRIEFISGTKIDEFFSGRLKTLFKVVGFAIKTNFADFTTASDKPAPVALAQ